MTQYYFDYAAGNDLNSGLTTASPKKTLTELLLRIGPGNVLSLNRGVIWPSTNLIALDINTVNPGTVCTINDYGSDPRPPIIDTLIYDNSAIGWSYDAVLATWKK